jgi:molybdenum cofactor guanylyltransferase
MAELTTQSDVAIALLAGGEARRFPHKLEQSIEGEPLLVRTFRAMRATHWPVYVCAKGAFPREIDLRLNAPRLIDPEPCGGPLPAFLAACAVIPAEYVFAVAADQPHLGARVLTELLAASRAGDEAVVPRHAGGIEPLAAIYLRRAVLRESGELRDKRDAAMRDLIERLNARFLPMDAKHFHNVNRPSDLACLAAGR